MPATGRNDISEFIDDLLHSIPGAQDNESVGAFKARVNADVATVVSALGRKLSETDRFIEERSTGGFGDAEQFYVSSRGRFVPEGDHEA